MRIAVVFLALFAATCSPPADTGHFQRVATLAENIDFLTGDVSPDGRYVSEIDWDTGDLQLIDLRTGEGVGVTGHGYADGGYAWMSAFSRDGRRIAVAWYQDRLGRHELRLVNRDGTGLRTLVPAHEDVQYIDPLDWMPSGDSILVAIGREDRTWQLALVDAADGSRRALATLGWLAPGGEQTYPNAYLSPDGRHVAYDYRPDLEVYPRDVRVLSVTDGSETVLQPGPGTDRVLGWLPARDGLLVYSDRGGEPGIWRFPVRDGRSAGEPERIRSVPPGLAPLGGTADGYLFGRAAATSQIHVGAIDPEAGRVLTPPGPVADPADRGSLAADWSPDGTRLIYNAFDPLPGGTESLVTRSAAGEGLAEVRLPAAFHASTGTLDWVSDSAIVMFGSVRGRFGVQQVDPRTGDFRTLPVSGEGLGGANLKWVETGPDGKVLYVFQVPSPGPGRPLLRIDAVTGGTARVGRYAADFRAFAVSPDGQRIALITRGANGATELRVIPATADAGPGRVVARTEDRPGLTTPVAWTPDGERLVYAERSESGQVLWAVPADGGAEPVRIGGEEWCCQGHDLRFHPDGRRIAVPAGTPRAEIWRLQLPTRR